MHSLSDPDDGLRLIINLCLLSYNLLFIHHTVLYTLNLLSLRPFVEYIECEMVSIALPPPPSNASIVPETVHLAQTGSYPWDRNHATFPLFHITTSPLLYPSGLALPSYPFKKKSFLLEHLLKDPLARQFWCHCHNLVLLKDFGLATPSISQTRIML